MSRHSIEIAEISEGRIAIYDIADEGFTVMLVFGNRETFDACLEAMRHFRDAHRIPDNFEHGWDRNVENE